MRAPALSSENIQNRAFEGVNAWSDDFIKLNVFYGLIAATHVVIRSGSMPLGLQKTGLLWCLLTEWFLVDSSLCVQLLPSHLLRGVLPMI